MTGAGGKQHESGLKASELFLFPSSALPVNFDTSR